jgi:hypothetical protein
MEFCVDYYMPNYSPYDVILIANDRAPKPIEDSVINAPLESTFFPSGLFYWQKL